MLVRDEEERDFPYDDATGKPVVAIGNVSIGIGSNLNARPLSPAAINFLLEEDIRDHLQGCVNLFGLENYSSLSVNRQLGLFALVFNLGEHKLRDEFTETYPALKACDWAKAGNLLRSTKWYRDVKKKRAERILALIEKDRYDY